MNLDVIHFIEYGIFMVLSSLALTCAIRALIIEHKNLSELEIFLYMYIIIGAIILLFIFSTTKGI